MEIKMISAMGMNCYLLSVGDGFILIDTGISFARRRVEAEIERAGCKPGNLKLIVLTHGDVDHVSNAAYLRDKFGTKIAMHPGDLKMVETGDLLASRPQKPGPFLRFIRQFFRLRKPNRFTPDIFLEEGDDLSSYGLDARIVHLPGHTNGSIAVLTRDSDLFCGDMYVFSDAVPHFGLGNPTDFAASAEKLKKIDFVTVYPGHGRSFSKKAYINDL